MALTPEERNQLINLVNKISTKAEATELFNHARNMIRTVRDAEANAVKRQIRVGDRVWFDAKTRGIIHGVVVKIMPKNVKVKADSGMNWKVFPSLLNAE